MTPTLVFAFAATWLAVGAALLVVVQRTRRMRQRLQEALHDRGLELDRRCDALQRVLEDQGRELQALRHRLDAVALIGRVDHLLGLVETAERRSLLAPHVATHLHTFGLELRAQARERERS